MKHLSTLRYYFSAQPLRHLWISTLVILACLCSVWYIWGYRPLLCATHNLEERLAFCTQTCEKDQQAQVTVKHLETAYTKTVAMLREYKGNLDTQTFYHNAVDQLLSSMRSAQCSLISFSSGVDVSQPFYYTYQATLVCDGTLEAVKHCLHRLSAERSLWRVTSVVFEKGRDSTCHLTLGVQCLVLV